MRINPHTHLLMCESKVPHETWREELTLSSDSQPGTCDVSDSHCVVRRLQPPRGRLLSQTCPLCLGSPAHSELNTWVSHTEPQNWRSISDERQNVFKQDRNPVAFHLTHRVSWRNGELMFNPYFMDVTMLVKKAAIFWGFLNNNWKFLISLSQINHQFQCVTSE